jgi:hypothetical protein
MSKLAVITSQRRSVRRLQYNTRKKKSERENTRQQTPVTHKQTQVVKAPCISAPSSKKAANTRTPRHAVITALAQALRKHSPSLCLCLTLRIRDKRFHVLSSPSLIETLSRPHFDVLGRIARRWSVVVMLGATATISQRGAQRCVQTILYSAWSIRGWRLLYCLLRFWSMQMWITLPS